MANSQLIDLRSDTVTKPSDGMREAMAKALVGDDVYGEDPTINSLEERVAKLFGKEAALFCPSGSLANQLAIRMLVAPGEELITETNSHIVRAELGAGAVFSGITTRTWLASRGLLSADDAINIARPDSGPYLVSTTAIAVENTHNFGGGTVQPISEIKKLREESEKLGIALHLDGARIWNAHIASGVELIEYGKYFDTLSVCLSKGLGAPVGSLMIASKERVAKARQWRKRYGGGMRQAGIVAAAGHYALDNNLPLLKVDHVRAKSIASAVAAVAPKVIDPATVDTNIVGLELATLKISASELSNQLKEKGILAGALGPKYLRLVTHLDLTDGDIEVVNQILPQLLQRALVS
ncbi:MAG: DegT/DnrJ/EryC1/StrS family aminotransferase [Candidatus Nanopelagicus sp.]|nr:DegT/DnrJ/EryC1/StrS family aminotransferase [Candidatus Nanopelagicus sp.]